MSSTPSQTPEPEDRSWEERLRASEETSSRDHGKGGGMKDKKRRSGKKDKKSGPRRADDSR